MRRSRSIAAYLAILAIALQALWPLLAQAKPKNVLLVPVCTVQGVTHYIELPAGGAPVERKAASQHDHCSFCTFGGGPVALSPGFSGFRALDLSSAAPPAKQAAFVERHRSIAARPRAPPFLPDVHLNSQHHLGRLYEEASAFGARGARAGDAVAGRGVVRLGVLLD